MSCVMRALERLIVTEENHTLIFFFILVSKLSELIAIHIVYMDNVVGIQVFL